MSDFPFDCVGFDLDGTLLDTSRDLGEAVNHALRFAGRPEMPIEGMANLIGGGAKRMLWRAFEAQGGIPQDEFDAIYAELLAHYRANIAVHSRPYPGCLDALDVLAKRGVKLAVVTNKFEALARDLLGQLDLTGRFACILGGDTLGPGRSKPQPDPLLEAMAQTGSTRFAFVGDTTYDIDAARAANVRSIAVSFGFNDRFAQELGADAVIDHYDALVPTLERLGQAG
ncbi:MAG: HAD-IA family hydrolase [Sphingomonadaceae bacterium]|nr:HAD-IA family hydrolase [Sphingomonadaceae bacterium]